MSRIALLFFFSCFSLSAFSQIQRPYYADGSVYYRFNTSDVQEISRKLLSDHPDYAELKGVLGRFTIKTFKPAFNTKARELSNIYRIEITEKERTEELMNALRWLPTTDYVEQVPAMYLDEDAFVPGDLENLWYLNKINMTEAWDLINTGNRIRVAVVDNAVRISHEDISDNLWTNPKEIPGNGLDDDQNGYIDDIHGFDVADNDNNPNPPAKASNTYFTHGTHVAGLTSASTNNSKGIASVGINTEIISVKVVSDNETDDYRLMYATEGIIYAVEAGADVINLSWGSYTSSKTQEMAINYAIDNGCIIVASAGNNSSANSYYPAAYPGVIAVGATDDNDFKAAFSNYGNYIDVMAPGKNIYSTLAGSDNSYGYMSGTSMAAPIVSGFIGLILSQSDIYPVKRQDVLALIKKGCDNIDLENYDYIGQMGGGRINVDRTLLYMKNPSLSITEQEDKLEVKVYPNPSDGIITIDRPVQDIAVEVLDMSGRQVFSEPVAETLLDLRTLHLQGMYLVKVSNTTGLSGMTRVIFR